MNTQAKTTDKRGVIYCRVSTKEQVDEGNSLATQEKYCRDYANKHDFEVAQVFVEQGESAKTANRTELQKLLMFCANKKNGINAIIIYKIDRLSRNTDDYSQLRIMLRRYGVEIKSTSEHFENTPAGRFMENTLANVAQFDNDVRTERSVGGMRDAMREGRYVLNGPIGFDNVRDRGKKNIAPNAMAPIVYRTFELIAKNIYPTEEVRKIMGQEGLVNKQGKPLSHGYFYRMLKNELYMGWIEMFGERHKGTGTFQPLVSEELFLQAQRVLKNKSWKMTAYITDNPDFPLRRFVKHPSILGLKLTGSWSRGRHGNQYAFYRFGMKGSNYQRDEFEKKFMTFMEEYRFDKSKVEKLKRFVRAKFAKATEQERQDAHKMRARLENLTEQETALIQKNFEGIISDAILKQQLDLVEKEKLNIQTALANIQDRELNADEMVAFCEGYLRAPSATWKKAGVQSKLKLQWFQFPSGVTFDGQLFGTPEISSVFQAKDVLEREKSLTVGGEGLEPPKA